MIFLDSSFLISYYIDGIKYHEEAVAMMEHLETESLLINNTVLTEVLNIFKENKQDNGVNDAFDFMKSFTIDYLTKEDYKSALDELNFYNQSINYADCTILVTMQKYDVHEILSFDSDFDGKKGICRYYKINE